MFLRAKQLWDRLLADEAETMSKRITAKRNRRTIRANEFLLTFGACLQGVVENGIKFFNIEINVNGGPVSAISADVVRALCRIGSCRFFPKTDFMFARLRHGITFDRPGYFNKSESVTKKKAVSKLWTSMEVEYFMALALMLTVELPAIGITVITVTMNGHGHLGSPAPYVGIASGVRSPSK
jgi:hypothetical protein